MTRAEAVGDVAAARSREAARLAIRHLGGALARSYDQIHADLADILAMLEGPLDFPDDLEEDSARASDQATERTARLEHRLTALAASHREGRRMTDGIEIPIVGRPNTGKSSLFNRLLAQDRAIVSPIPGTTRDFIEAPIHIQGCLVRLVDTAGYGVTADPIEAEGVRRTVDRVGRADLVVAVFDASGPLAESDRGLVRALAGRPVVPVLNKSDLAPVTSTEDILQLGLSKPLAVSAATGEGLDRLWESLAERGVNQTREAGHGETPVTSARQAGLLERAAEETGRALANLSNGAPELAVEDLRATLRVLGELVGTVTDEEVLDGIFRNFCIGK
jgi:tRNA modification GTPase